jgi:hypothetical protein
MENDHLNDAILFLKSCLENTSKGYKADMYAIERAIEEIELAIDPPRDERERARIVNLPKNSTAVVTGKYKEVPAVFIGNYDRVNSDMKYEVILEFATQKHAELVAESLVKEDAVVFKSIYDIAINNTETMSQQRDEFHKKYLEEVQARKNWEARAVLAEQRAKRLLDKFDDANDRLEQYKRIDVVALAVELASVDGTPTADIRHVAKRIEFILRNVLRDPLLAAGSFELNNQLTRNSLIAEASETLQAIQDGQVASVEPQTVEKVSTADELAATLAKNGAPVEVLHETGNSMPLLTTEAELKLPLRDLFAIEIMACYLNGVDLMYIINGKSEPDLRGITSSFYKFADAMMQARNTNKGEQDDR